MIHRFYRFFFLLLAIALVFRIGYLYFEVGKGIGGRDGEAASIFYGRPAELRKGDHPGNNRFVERLQRLNYKKVTVKPSTAGTFSEEPSHIRVSLRNKGTEKKDEPVDITIRDGRVQSIMSANGTSLASIHLEPEEIGRIIGPKMESRKTATLATISPYVQNAVLATEDARFYFHTGVDLLAAGRALSANLKEQRYVQGGSTITQQLAKNFFLSPRKTIGRKLQELELAFVLELRYTKKQILEMYLNNIYLGQEGSLGIYGVEDAAIFYFSKHARDVSLAEAALLAGIIHSPNRYSLIKNPAKAKERRNLVLDRMKKLSMISAEEYDRAVSEPVRIRPHSYPRHQSSYFIDYIQRITKEELGNEKYYQPGYRYYTTLDPIIQSIAEQAVSEGLAQISGTAYSAGEPLQAALVAVDARTGELVAMVGGRDYGQSRFNRAIDARRQPGSAFKPFVLLAALSGATQGKANMTLSSTVSGESLSLPTPEGMWSPANFEDKEYGKITIRKTIEDSVNTATTKLASDIGFEEVLNAARLAGIKSPLAPIPSLPLGSFEVTPLEIVYAYATIASGGIRSESFPLYSVTTADGGLITTRTVHREQAFDPRVAYLAAYAMEGVLTRGTAKDAAKLGINFPASGKTGTTNGNRDSWFVGFTPDIVCAVWVGYDVGKDTGLTGAQGALRIWARFMRTMYSKARPSAMSVPEGIETAMIDPESGYLVTTACPQKIKEAYLAGTAPKESCPLHPVNVAAEAVRKGMRSIGDFFRRLFK